MIIEACRCGGIPLSYASGGYWVVICRADGCTNSVVGYDEEDTLEEWNRREYEEKIEINQTRMEF